jgi:serine/threonine-protein kinase
MPLEAGSLIGAYEIGGLIGAGGMGEVYRARDTRLQRDVAIKVLPAHANDDATARERLVREAQTASKLNHPNICTVYDAGVTGDRVFIAMELVEGVALSTLLSEGAQPIERAVRYAIQIADGLGHAHQRGVIHRDLKCANVAITPDGRVKLLDFGLAKHVADAGALTETAAPLTGQGTVVGTVAYMAPEVLRGAPADARSDVWSLGVILFEMATGGRPFGGASVFELTSAILTTAAPPLPPEVPGGVAAVIETALAKQPGERYQQAAELRAALDAVSRSGSAPVAVRRPPRRWLTAAAVTAAVVIAAVSAWRLMRPEPAGADAPVRAIAVLPLSNLSGDPAQDLFADGITEALITDLARVKGLDVISRTSAMQYRGTSKRLPDIARELTVDAVVQGSVMRAGNRVRVSAQLIDAIYGPTSTIAT